MVKLLFSLDKPLWTGQPLMPPSLALHRRRQRKANLTPDSEIAQL